jgi:hypothetical protein
VPRYPDIEPYETGLLDTGDGNLVYRETCGNPGSYGDRPDDAKLAFVRTGSTTMTDEMHAAAEPPLRGDHEARLTSHHHAAGTVTQVAAFRAQYSEAAFDAASSCGVPKPGAIEAAVPASTS